MHPICNYWELQVHNVDSQCGFQSISYHPPQILCWHADVVVNVTRHFLVLWGHRRCNIMAEINTTNKVLRGNPQQPLHRLLFLMFYMNHPIDRRAHTIAFVTPVVEHLLGKRNSSMGPPSAIDPTTHCTMSRRSTTATSRCHTFNRSEYNRNKLKPIISGR